MVGAGELTHDLVELVLIASDAQLLHFPASGVRPQGRTGGGMAGIRLDRDAKVVFFGTTPTADSSVVTVAGSSAALPGTRPGASRSSWWPSIRPRDARRRALREGRGQPAAGMGDPAIAAASSGTPIDLPVSDVRREASGVLAAQPITAVGSRYHA